MMDAELGREEFAKVLALIYRAAGIRIPDTKRVMITNRLRKRLKATGIETYAAYYTYLTSLAGRAEMPLFLDAITTNETYFFRDPQHYQWLADSFLPEAAEQAARRERPKRLRIWSAACSTGEEPYSIAMKILAKRGLFAGWDLKVVGTDLSTATLRTARLGSYDERAVRLVASADRSDFFEHDAEAGRWVVKPEVRALPSWRHHNLLQPLKEEPFDCIFLKNVLIYFDAESKKVAIGHLLDRLAMGGYLVVGPTEGVYNLLGPLHRLRTWLYRRVP